MIFQIHGLYFEKAGTLKLIFEMGWLLIFHVLGRTSLSNE